MKLREIVYDDELQRIDVLKGNAKRGHQDLFDALVKLTAAKAQARRSVAAQLRLPGRRVEKRHVPAMRQRVALAQGHGVACLARSACAKLQSLSNCFALLALRRV